MAPKNTFNMGCTSAFKKQIIHWWNVLCLIPNAITSCKNKILFLIIILKKERIHKNNSTKSTAQFKQLQQPVLAQQNSSRTPPFSPHLISLLMSLPILIPILIPSLLEFLSGSLLCLRRSQLGNLLSLHIQFSGSQLTTVSLPSLSEVTSYSALISYASRFRSHLRGSASGAAFPQRSSASESPNSVDT